MPDFGTRIWRLRKDAGQTLQTVANAVGSTKSYIWELERGRTDNPGIKLATALADHFDVSLSYLVAGEADASDPPAWHFYHRYQGRLTAADWAALRGVAERLAIADVVADREVA